MRPAVVRPGSIVVVAAFDEVPEHLFLVQEVFEDFVAGVALTGPLAGAYGEPDRSQVRPLGTDQSL
jgi:hypothetical protein